MFLPASVWFHACANCTPGRALDRPALCFEERRQVWVQGFKRECERILELDQVRAFTGCPCWSSCTALRLALDSLFPGTQDALRELHTQGSTVILAAAVVLPQAWDARVLPPRAAFRLGSCIGVVADAMPDLAAALERADAALEQHDLLVKFAEPLYSYCVYLNNFFNRVGELAAHPQLATEAQLLVLAFGRRWRSLPEVMELTSAVALRVHAKLAGQAPCSPIVFMLSICADTLGLPARSS